MYFFKSYRIIIDEFQESNVVAAAKQLELGDEIVSQEDKLKVI